MCDNDRIPKWMPTLNCKDICASRNYVPQISDGCGTKYFLSLFLKRILSHDNAVLGRGFSAQNFLLAKSRFLHDEYAMIGAVKKNVRLYSWVRHIPVTKELL